MAKVTKVTFSANTGNQIVIPAGQYSIVKVPVAPEGRITKVVVLQSGGTQVAFNVDMFDAVNQPGLAIGNFSAALPANIELWRIFAQKPGTSGSAVALYEDTIGFSYTTPDGTPTVRSRAVYLCITPTAAAGSTSWSACVVSESFYGTG